MDSSLLRYYIFKDTLSQISPQITYTIDTSNQVLFKYALFYSVGKFYKAFHPFKKDAYQLSIQIKQHLQDFLKECMEDAYFHASNEEMLFCYFIFLSYIVEISFSDYVTSFVTKKKNTKVIIKNIEAYLFHKYEGTAIHKMNLSNYFFDSFALSDADLHLIEKPIKRIFGFFCTKQYYKSSYQSAKFYYDHLATSRTGIKKPFFFLYDIFLNHRKNKMKAKHFLYPKKIDSTFLNLSKSEIQMEKEIKNYSFEELYQITLEEAKKGIDILNSYFTSTQNFKAFDAYFQKKSSD